MPHPRETMDTMAERYARPDWVRRINAMGESVGGARRLIPMDPDALIDAARVDLGSEDFGEGAWRERFVSLVEEIDASDLHALGRLMTRQELARSLRTRALMARALHENPGIVEEEIRSPMVVTGPARSGTTILFELLGLDPELRAPLAWEGIHPLPLPDAPGDRRPGLAECEQEFWADVAPEFAAVHELRADLPVECVTLTMPSFAGSHWPMIAPLSEWIPDLPESYRYHRQLLQTLQWGTESKTWLLKTPAHLTTLGMLFDTYPDCWVVQTHRDPVKTMPSTVSTTAIARWMRSDHLDLPLLSQVIDATFSAALLGVIEQRKSGTVPSRFVDVHFQSLMKDPIETLRVAYGQMGRELGREHAERIRKYLAEKPRGKFGVHRYTPEEWGFESAELRARLAPYTEHYGIELEA